MSRNIWEVIPVDYDQEVDDARTFLKSIAFNKLYIPPLERAIVFKLAYYAMKKIVDEKNKKLAELGKQVSQLKRK
jgi:hypothetical protein